MSGRNITIVQQLDKLSLELDAAVTQMAVFEELSVDAEADYKLAYSKAFQAAPGAMEMRKQIAIAECDTEFRVWGKAAAAVRIQKEHIRALHTRIDVGRTLQATARAEIALAGYGAGS